MNFGQALEALKQGHKIARQGWNGKGMYLFLNEGCYDSSKLHIEKGLGQKIEGIPIGLFNPALHGTVTKLPNINMRSASGATVTGWLASQTDMLAEDWEVLP